jgi:hypothetical protein
MPKRPTHVAHLLEDQLWVIKAAPDWIGIVAALIVFSLVVLHHLLTVFVFEDQVGRNYRCLA